MDAIARLVLIAFGCFLVVLSKDKNVFLLFRIHKEFNNLLNVNESADVRQEVRPINFVSKKESFCLFDVRQVETTIHFIPYCPAVM